MPVPVPAPLPKQQLPKKIDLLAGSQFLSGFNPESSRRESKKRQIYSKTPKVRKQNSNSMYDDQGKLRSTKEDICDCFDSKCPGCHFECESCGSQKCGPRCRVNRKWAFEIIEYDGKELVRTNPLVTTISYN